jgi:hypothetical protein
MRSALKTADGNASTVGDTEDHFMTVEQGHTDERSAVQSEYPHPSFRTIPEKRRLVHIQVDTAAIGESGGVISEESEPQEGARSRR